MKLKEILTINYGKNQKEFEVKKSQIPIFGTSGVIGYSSKPLYEKESILLGRVGTINKIYYVNTPFWVVNTLFFTKVDTSVALVRYLYYHLLKTNLWKYHEGSAVPRMTRKRLYNIDIKILPMNQQQHIVDIIGSVDDLIENLVKRIKILFNIGTLKINNLNNCKIESLSNFASFKKGIEVGSSNYYDYKDEGMLNYIRVADLISLGDTFIKINLPMSVSKFDDILCAFDGAPGRNNIGLIGAYSSGIYSLNCSQENKGWLYFEINSNLNQEIISNYSCGTTIKHASKAIPFLKCRIIDESQKKYFNLLFNSILQNKKKIGVLKEIKTNLLDKYF